MTNLRWRERKKENVFVNKGFLCVCVHAQAYVCESE